MVQTPKSTMTALQQWLSRPAHLAHVGLGVIVLGLGPAWKFYPGDPFTEEDLPLQGAARWVVPLALVTMCAGLIMVTVAIQRRLRQAGEQWQERLESSALLGEGVSAAILVRLGFQPWDSARYFFNVLILVALVGSQLVLLPRLVRRIIVSILVLFHFGGIVTAVTSVAPRDQPAPWLSHQLWTRVYRPYLTFMYLTNAYHFYSPDPGPPSLLWFRIEAKDDFSLTDKSLADLRAAKVPPEVLAKLAPLKGTVFQTTKSFVEELAKVLDTEELERFKWLVVKHVEGTKTVRWYKVPARGEDPIALHYQRFLALAESTNQPLLHAPYTEAQKAMYYHVTKEAWPNDSWENIYGRRVKGAAKTARLFALTSDSLESLGLAGVPQSVLNKLTPLTAEGLDSRVEFVKHLAERLDPSELATYQDLILKQAVRTAHLDIASESPYLLYSELQDMAKRLVASYAEHLARSEPKPVQSVRVYRLTHRIIAPYQLAEGVSPLYETFYVPYYLGKFDVDGQLLDPQDPFLYWYLPIVSVPPDYGRPAGTKQLELNRFAKEGDTVVNGLKIHAEDLLVSPDE